MAFRFRAKSGNKTFDEPSYIYKCISFITILLVGLCNEQFVFDLEPSVPGRSH